MRYSRLICSMLTFLILLSSISIVTASAATDFTNVTVSEDSKTGVATISGRAGSKETVVVMVLKADKTMTDVYEAIANNALADVLIYSTSVKTTSNGDFTVVFDIRRAFGEAVETGAYPIVLSNGKSISDGEYLINHYNMEDINAALNAVNKAKDALEVELAIKNHMNTIGLDETLLNACEILSTEEKETLYGAFLNQNFEEITDIKDIFESRAPYAVLRMAETAEEIAGYLVKFNLYYELPLEDAEGPFSKIEDEKNKMIVYKDMIHKGAFISKEDTAETFFVASVLGYLNDVIAPGTMLDVLAEYKEVFDISLSEFNKLSKTKQNSVLTDLVNTVMDDSAKVKETFDQKVSYYASQVDEGNKGGSGSSSGGRGSFGGGKTTVNISGGNTKPSIPPVIDGNIPENTDNSKVFNDLDSVKWAETAILELHKKGIVQGRGEGIFDPNSNITRAEFVKMISLAFDIQNQDIEVSFNDVVQGAWYYDAVMKAAASGLVLGNEMGNFAPDRLISREEMAIILYRVAKQKEINLEKGDVSFADAEQISSFAVEAVGAMQKNGIINGVGDNKFSPKSNATRAQASQMIYQMLNR